MDRDRDGFPFGLSLCRACGLGVQQPRLTDAALEQFYRRDYRLVLLGGAPIDQADFERGKRRGAGIDTFLRQAGFDLRGGLVLEIGSGSGGILAHFAERGCDVRGWELDPECVAYANREGIPTERGSVERLRGVATAPALVILSHLVEHLPRPMEFLEALRERLDDRTLLYVEVPGLRNPKIDPFRTHQVAHLFFYELTTLTWLAGLAGFTLLEVDEGVQSVFRRGEGRPVELTGNFERNRAVVERWAAARAHPA
jgi:SAM-dependent methyltransferase